jgi:isopentenyl-diphosphate delta-isomerase type 1
MTEEVFDLVDREGTIIGQASRHDCHHSPGHIHRTVHIIVTDQDGNLYLQKRALTKDIEPGRWDTSVGGHVARGETIEAAADRELQEELGIAAEDVSLVFLYRFLWESPIETELVSTFHAVYNGPFRLQEDEIDEGRFWSPEEIRQKLGQGLFTPNFEMEFRRFTAKPRCEVSS